MALWLIIMFVGLGALGFVFYKVWTAPASGIERKWLAWALGGTLISIVGLVMTLRSVQKEPSEAFIPRATLQPGTPGKPTVPGGIPGAPGTPGTPTTPQPGTTPESGIPKYDPKQFPEDPAGPPFVKDDYKYFVGESRRILTKLEEQAAIEQQPNRAEVAAGRANRWMLFYEDYEGWLAHLRGRSAERNGPGTGHTRQLVYQISETLEKMVRVYYNSYANGEEPDMQYISDLRGLVESYATELERQSGEH